MSRIIIVGTALLLALASVARADECVDENAGCTNWASSGECDRNPGFMHSACAKSCKTCPTPVDPKLIELGEERVTLHIENFGEIELGFYPNAAPVTVAHILKLFRMGCYDTNHIFRVDRGFVAQIQSVGGTSVTKPLSRECDEEAAKNVPGEFTGIRHKRGILSMGRMCAHQWQSNQSRRDPARAHHRARPWARAHLLPTPADTRARALCSSWQGGPKLGRLLLLNAIRSGAASRSAVHGLWRGAVWR